MSEGFALAFAPAAAEFKHRVMCLTWGHLAPKVSDHPVRMLFTLSGYGDYTLIDSSHPTLSDSPWLYPALYEHACKLAKRQGRGAVLEWSGTLRWFSNGGHRFVHGTLRVIHRPYEEFDDGE